MESKRNNTNVLLFGLSFNVILTLGLLGFMCYSFHRLDSRLTAVEHDLLSTSRQQRLANRVHVDSTPLHLRQSRSGEKEAVVKRAVDAPSMCSKCSSVCGHPNVSCSLLANAVRSTNFGGPFLLGKQRDKCFSEYCLLVCHFPEANEFEQIVVTI